MINSIYINNQIVRKKDNKQEVFKMNENFKNRVEELLISKGKTQKWLAGELKVSEVTV